MIGSNTLQAESSRQAASIPQRQTMRQNGKWLRMCGRLISAGKSSWPLREALQSNRIIKDRHLSTDTGIQCLPASAEKSYLIPSTSRCQSAELQGVFIGGRGALM